MILYPCGLVLLYGVLLFKCRPGHRGDSTSNLAQATTFLTKDYKTEAHMWEVWDMIRRTVLMG